MPAFDFRIRLAKAEQVGPRGRLPGTVAFEAPKTAECRKLELEWDFREEEDRGRRAHRTQKVAVAKWESWEEGTSYTYAFTFVPGGAHGGKGGAGGWYVRLLAHLAGEFYPTASEWRPLGDLDEAGSSTEADAMAVNRTEAVPVQPVAAVNRKASENPQSGELEELLARADEYIEKARWYEAIEIYRRAIEHRPEDADLHNDLGTLYAEIGEKDQEGRAYLQAIRLRPDHATAHLNLGMWYEQQEKYEDALQSYEQCIQATTSEEEREEARKLVRGLVAKGEVSAGVTWVQVTETHGPMLAEMMVERLRGQGIKAVVWQGGAGNALGLHAGQLGTTRVMVPEADLEQARKLLEADEDS